MVRQALDLLDLPGRRVLVDCTVGLGGHAQAMLAAAGPAATLIGLDVDVANLEHARRRLADLGGRVRLFHANFAQVRQVLDEAAIGPADALLADLGVGSMQLDDPARGLSFQADGPLDMRLDDRLDVTAGDLVNRLGESELADLIYEYGQERYSRRIARAIAAARRERPIRRTLELAEIVGRAMPAPARRTRHGVHPATRTFQALRIAVNHETENLQALLDRLPEVLAPGGRAAVISFHSLEDGPVKRALAALAQAGQGRLLTRKPLTAGPDEAQRNPRSRSAKLRGIEILPGSLDGATRS
jgi:16S rRNA (cytosine1402-N4)-methyltransferase